MDVRSIKGDSHLWGLPSSRHYGGCTFQGREYLYIPTTDELVRADVVKWLGARRRTAKKAAAQKSEEKQGKLF